jgi:hypothetical protein
MNVVVATEPENLGLRVLNVRADTEKVNSTRLEGLSERFQAGGVSLRHRAIGSDEDQNDRSRAGLLGENDLSPLLVGEGKILGRDERILG